MSESIRLFLNGKKVYEKEGSDLENRYNELISKIKRYVYERKNNPNGVCSFEKWFAEELK
jgi:hypothetical protein